MNHKIKHKRKLKEGTDEYIDGFAFWDDIKKKFYFLYLFIIILILVVPLFFGVNIIEDWFLIVFLELCTLPILFGIFMIRYVIIPHKSRLVKKIESFKQNEMVIYEYFDDKINFSVRSSTSICCPSLFLYFLIFLFYFGVNINSLSIELLILVPLIFFYTIIFPGILNRKKDRIWVDPKTKRFIVRKKYFSFIYGRKRFYQWSELRIGFIGNKDSPSDEHIELFFDKKHRSYFRTDDYDYLQIVPEALKALKSENDNDRLIALKSLSMYNTKKTISKYLAISLYFLIALIEILFLSSMIF